MIPAVASDALCPHTLRVDAETRAADVMALAEQIHATHAVVFDRERFFGVARLQANLYRTPQRIFADLVLRPPPPAVAAETPLDELEPLLAAGNADAIRVTAADADHLGLVTGTSLLRALLAAARGQGRGAKQLERRQERLSALGLMTGGMVHDGNNSLSPLVGQLELLRLFDRILPPEGRDRLAAARLAADDAVAAIRRLQQFTGADTAARPGPVDPGGLLDEVRDLTRPMWCTAAGRAGKRIALEVDRRPVPLVLGVAGQLREVLVNLVSNAIDAIAASGRILLQARAEDHRVLIAVRDTGCGMSPAVRQRCCERFFSTKGDRGTGLGLAVSAELVACHHGRLEIDSTPGAGTTVRVILPAARHE